MATTAPKRVVVSELQETTATLKVGDFDVNFNYKNAAGEGVTSVQATASNGNKYFSYIINGDSTSISFNNMALDPALLSAVQIEVDDIMKQVAAE